MKIASITGVTRSNELSITKSIGSVIIASNLAFTDLTTEKISIYIERGNGANVILVNKILLKDFLISSTFGNSALQSDSTYATIALCEIASEGSVYLAEKESIKIQLDDLVALKLYDVYGVEEPVQTNDLLFFEQKSIASEEVNKKIDVSGFDLAIVNMDATISDISFYFENGQVVKYLPFELQTLSCDIDPVAYITSAGVVSQRLSGRIALPLLHVQTIEINKSQGVVVNFVVRHIKTV